MQSPIPPTPNPHYTHTHTHTHTLQHYHLSLWDYWVNSGLFSSWYMCRTSRVQLEPLYKSFHVHSCCINLTSVVYTQVSKSGTSSKCAIKAFQHFRWCVSRLWRWIFSKRTFQTADIFFMVNLMLQPWICLCSTLDNHFSWSIEE